MLLTSSRYSIAAEAGQACASRITNGIAVATPGLNTLVLASSHTLQPMYNVCAPGTTDRSILLRPSDREICAGIISRLEAFVALEKVYNDITKNSELKTMCEASTRADADAGKEEEIQPYGNEGYECKGCQMELANSYFQCVGCFFHQGCEYNLCFGCFQKRICTEHTDAFTNLDKRSHKDTKSTIYNHIIFKAPHQCPRCNTLQNITPPVDGDCLKCKKCTHCSCVCHKKYKLRYRFFRFDDLKKLLGKVKVRARWAQVQFGKDDIQRAKGGGRSDYLSLRVPSSEVELSLIALLKCLQSTPGFLGILSRMTVAKVLSPVSSPTKVVRKTRSSDKQKDQMEDKEVIEGLLFLTSEEWDGVAAKEFVSAAVEAAVELVRPPEILSLLQKILECLHRFESLGRGYPTEYPTAIDYMFGHSKRHRRVCSKCSTNTASPLVWTHRTSTFKESACTEMTRMLLCKICNAEVMHSSRNEWWQLPNTLVLSRSVTDAEHTVQSTLVLKEKGAEGPRDVSYSLYAAIGGVLHQPNGKACEKETENLESGTGVLWYIKDQL